VEFCEENKIENVFKESIAKFCAINAREIFVWVRYCKIFFIKRQ
jgi:hypothetical protein